MKTDKRDTIRLIVFLGIWICFPLISVAQELLTFDHNGVTREYILYKPDKVSSDPALVFVLHGYTSTAEARMRVSGMNSIADKEGFIVCYPQGLKDNGGTTHWNARLTISSVDDIGFLSELAQFLHTEHALDPGYTFVCGMSNGGFMSYTLACEAPEIFKAAAPVAGLMSGSTWENRNPSAAIPILHIHGTADYIVPIDGSMTTNGGWGGAPELDTIINYWVDLNNCTVKDSTFFPPGTNAYYFRNGTNGKEVWYYKINDMGHSWPTAWTNNGTVASEVIWEFFSQYSANTPIKKEATRANHLADFTVYLNTCNSRLVIENKIGGTLNYRIVNVNGTQLLSGRMKQQHYSIDIRLLSQRIYVLFLEGKEIKKTYTFQNLKGNKR